MNIAFTHNLKRGDAEEEAEFDTAETIAAITAALERLGHRVDPVEVGGPPSATVARLEALSPDLVFNTAEGSFGRYREAFYPGMFEQLGLPFTGSDAYVCTLTLDKHLTKAVVAQGGVPVPRARLVQTLRDLAELDMRPPLMVKPNFEGSSKGITQDSVVEDMAKLEERVRDLLKRFPSGILVEAYIEGRDVTVPFLEAAAPKTQGLLCPVEYVFGAAAGAERRYAIYDYRLKNETPDLVSVRVPAAVDADTERALNRHARTAYRLLGIRDFGRLDFRVTPDGHVYFIEANALPSLEPEAGIYAAAKEAGVGGIEAVLDAIVESADRRQRLRGDRRRPRRSSRGLKIGFTYNEKSSPAAKGAGSDAEAEFDSPSTLNSIRTAIASFGHELVDLEATPDLPGRLAGADVDLVFNIAEGMRGRYRESQVPALLELMNIPYTGSDAAALALTLDKGLAKRIVREAGVPTPRFFVMATGKEKIPPDFSFPLIVKPVAEGSSKGVTQSSVVHNDEEMRREALEQLRRYDQPVLVEEYLSGREFTLALLGERRPRVLPPMEIVFGAQAGTNPVYTYEHKLAANEAIRYQAPAQIGENLRRGLERAARRAFTALGCRDVARIDLRLDGSGRPHFLECNPLPGLTPGWSDLCLIAESAKMDYRTLIGEILAPAIRRFKEKHRTLLERQSETAAPADDESPSPEQALPRPGPGS